MCETFALFSFPRYEFISTIVLIRLRLPSHQVYSPGFYLMSELNGIRCLLPAREDCLILISPRISEESVIVRCVARWAFSAVTFSTDLAAILPSPTCLTSSFPYSVKGFLSLFCHRHGHVLLPQGGRSSVENWQIKPVIKFVTFVTSCLCLSSGRVTRPWAIMEPWCAVICPDWMKQVLQFVSSSSCYCTFLRSTFGNFYHFYVVCCLS